MEWLFSPCTRIHDRLERGGHLRCPERLHEVKLDVSIEELVSAERAFTYGDLYAMLGNEYTVAWLTLHAAVTRLEEAECFWPCRLSIIADENKGIIAFSRYPEHLLEICDVVLRLLAASDVHSVILQRWSCPSDVSINAPALAYLLQQCQSLKCLTLKDQTLDENHFRVLGDYSRPRLEIELTYCKLTNAGTSALAEVLGRNQGPTKLDCCCTDYSVLADGLRGNTRLKSFQPRICSSSEVNKREVLAIADALRENKGLVELNLSYGCFGENDETWSVICDALKTHPTLEVLNLISALTVAAKIPAVITSRMHALLDMMKMNQLIHTIRLLTSYIALDLFQGSVLPYLETNQLRPRLLAIQKTRPIPYRTKVLGRALLSARSDANSFWMLLSGNAEVAFPSTIATTSLPTPATAAATCTSNAATATAALSSTAGATPTFSASAVESVAPPTVVRKRKSLP
jgi:hypothetical protein